MRKTELCSLHLLKVTTQSPSDLVYIPRAIQWAIPEKIQKSGKSGVEDIDFPGVKKKHVEILGVNLKRSRTYRDVLKKFPWVLVLLTSKGVTQFFKISRGQSLFLRVK